MTRTDSSPVALEPAAVDLLAALAYSELVAFERLAADARAAPSLPDKAALSEMAAAEYTHFQALETYLAERGVDVTAATEPFVDAVRSFHAMTEPHDWLERLVKAYVGDGIGTDFYREIADRLAEPTRGLVLDVLADTGHAAFAVERVRAAVAEEPLLAGRLALWARQVVAEAMAQALSVAVQHEALMALITRGPDGAEASLEQLVGTFTRMTAAHGERMEALGLES